METKTKITVEAHIEADIQKVWDSWTQAKHIMNWNFASEDWHCPHAEVNLTVGGKMTATMAAKDGSFSFDFGGEYQEIDPLKKLSTKLDDGRLVEVSFEKQGEHTFVREIFEAENQNPIEMQQAGWQSILNNFKTYCEKT